MDVSVTKVAVTGGAGQLGTLVMRRLIDDPRIERILCLDVRPPSLVSDKLEFLPADVRSADFTTLLSGVEGVFHFAFIVTQRVDPEVFDAVNVEGSRRVFEQGIAAGVKRFVYASSMAAYGVVDGHPVPIVEDTPRVFQPSFPYSAAKHRVEAFLDELEPRHPDVAIGRLRPAILIGTHMQNPGAKLVGRLFDRGLVPGTHPDIALPLVWDDDVAAAAMTIMRDGKRGAFNLGADEPLPPAELAAATGLKVVTAPPALLDAMTRLGPLLEKLGAQESVDPSWHREGAVRMILSSRRAVDELGWQRRCPTCADVVRHYLAEAPGRTHGRIATFLRMVDLGSRSAPVDPALSAADGDALLELRGRGGGEWTLRAPGGRLRITRGIPRPPSSIASIPAGAFLEALAGETTWPELERSEAVRLEGSPAAGIMLGAMFSRWERSRARDGLSGRVSRAFHRWVLKGTA